MLARLHDPLLAVLSVGLVALLIQAVRWMHRRWPLSPADLRKLLHALIGLVALAMTVLFHSRAWALVPPALFTAHNLSPRLRASLPELARNPREARGLWMFPLGVCLVYLLFWDFDHRGAVLAGIASLALADPAAALVGTKLGQRRFPRWAHGRTVEGSLAFFVIAGAVSAWVATSVPGGHAAVRVGVGCGLAGAAAEALSPTGFDNVTVPLLVAAAYRLLA